MNEPTHPADYVAIVAAALDDDADVWQLARMAVQALEQAGAFTDTYPYADLIQQAERWERTARDTIALADRLAEVIRSGAAGRSLETDSALKAWAAHIDGFADRSGPETTNNV